MLRFQSYWWNLHVFVIFQVFTHSQKYKKIPDVRPSVSNRTYHSESIEQLINTLQPLFVDKDVGTLFTNCLPNTLDTTIASFSIKSSSSSSSIPIIDTFIVTGDIHALWLRDSTNQVIPYLPYATDNDKSLQNLIEGLINRQALSILIDPYANAFNFNDTRSNQGHQHQSDQRIPPMNEYIFEGKYEIDSLCTFLKLSYWYYYARNAALFRFATSTWFDAVELILNTFTLMQQFNDVIFQTTATTTTV